MIRARHLPWLRAELRESINSSAGRRLRQSAPVSPTRKPSASFRISSAGTDSRSCRGLLGTSRGRYGPMTTAAVRHFQSANDLDDSGAVNQATLQAMIEVPAVKPSVGRGYVTLVLDFEFTAMMQVASITAQFEGAGLFTAINRNPDRAGLSCGIILWAQKPGR